MAKDDDEDLPDKDAAKGFYAKYEPKEILGRFVKFMIFRSLKFPQCQFKLKVWKKKKKNIKKTSKEPLRITTMYRIYIQHLSRSTQHIILSKFLSVQFGYF